jgi:hypothetical protein
MKFVLVQSLLLILSVISMNSTNVFGKFRFFNIANNILLRFPIVAACVLRWIEFRIFDPSYFKLDQGTTPVHLIIIDEVNRIK